ncbi:MAG: ABC transporter permease [Lachnospiraceae bacterium]|nr:ABC transporter permease [Lachnospiraceae bacterium]
MHENDPKETNGKSTPSRIFGQVREFFKKDLVSYITKRILMFIPTLFLISVLVFFVIQLPPGDYVSSEIARLTTEGELVTQADADALREQYGLDQPVIVQYFKWIGDIIWTPTDSQYYRLNHSHHNWKYSFKFSKNVWDVINERLATTVIFTAVIMLFQYLVSIPIAIYSSTHQYSVGDYTASVIGFLGTAIPNFCLAIILMYLSYKWTGNSNTGLFTPEMKVNGVHLYNFGELCKRMIIPLIVLGTSGTCGIIRSVRAQMLDEVGRQYTLTARAKGVSERKIIMKYCFRAAINPTVSGLGGILSSLFSGSTVTAIVLDLELQGPQLFEALKAQDMYLAGAIVMVQAVLVVIGILFSDIALALLDPRIRYSGGGR